MIYDHHTHPRLISDQVHVHLVGAGGSGSLMLTGLARLHTAIVALGHPGLHVTCSDPDRVSAANLGRQLFTAADVGAYKAEVLITRLNSWFGLDWRARPHAWDSTDLSHELGNIVVSCVDSAQARVGIAQDIERTYRKPYYWLDLGNRAGDGQVVLGIPPWSGVHAAYEYRLPTVVELFPELEQRTADFDHDDTPSCSLAQALERQALFVNQSVATPALQLLWNIFRHGRTHWCGAFVNADDGRTVPIPVDPAAWARIGYTRPALPAGDATHHATDDHGEDDAPY